MKELSIEEKAKAYDKIIGKAKKELDACGSQDCDAAKQIFRFFPELKETDERIRKALIDGFTVMKESKNCGKTFSNHNIPVADILTWLEKQVQTFTKKDVDDAYLKGVTDTKNEIEKQCEANYQIRKDIATFIFNYRGVIKDRAKWMDYLGIKASFVEKQGEQKPVDKVEPKFKVGNWYQCTKDFFGKGVTFDKNTAYYCAKEGCLQDEYGCHIAIVKDLYDYFKLWTIQDAKDGDVLSTSVGAFIYNGNNGGGSCPGSYCGIDNLGKFRTGVKHHWTGKPVYPATKEQRDQLEKAMADAGYTFDFEKKELKKIEQKEINLIEILKHYPRETELYSPLYGKLWLAEVDEKNEIIICYKHKLEEGCTRAILEQEDTVSFYSNGTTGMPDFNVSKDCMLFLYDVEKQNDLSKWNIKYAVPGDILAGELDGYPSPFVAIFKEHGLDFFNSYCSLNIGGDFNAFENTGHSIFNIHPATKEQRDLLFQKMKEEGYEWDAEKKELKKVVAPKFNVHDCIIKKHNSNINDFGSFVITDITGGKYWYNDRIICNISEQDEWELYEPIKQNPDEWSDDDEQYLLVCKNALAKYQITDKWDASIISHWLENKVKSFRPQLQWKPSEEQLDALHDAAVYVDKSMFPYPKGILMKLYKQIKKLREE